MTNTTVRLRATNGTVDIVHEGQHFTPDLDGIFSVPSDVVPELLRLPLGLELAPDTAEPAPRTVDFLAPAPFATFDVGAVGFRKYAAEADSISLRRRGGALLGDGFKRLRASRACRMG